MDVIESFEYFDYRPSSTEDYNSAGSEFNISVLNENMITQPSKRVLVLKGTISASRIATDATAATAATEIVDTEIVDLEKMQ